MENASLNRLFGIKGSLEFFDGKGGLSIAKLMAGDATASVSTYAGQVLSYRPQDAEDVFFLSNNAHFERGKAIKGGVPVCWPWFGPDPEGLGRPNHGFVRNRPWQIRGGRLLSDGAVELLLGLEDDAETRKFWPHAFDLEMRVTLGDRLEIGLLTRNRSKQPMTISQALHSYFLVGDIGEISVGGLANLHYIDKVYYGTLKSQQGIVQVSGETDRIYLDVDKPIDITDRKLGRRIQLSAAGSHSTVVWNPWVEVAKSMSDLEDNDYQRMICVETANAASDEVHIAPGGEHRLMLQISSTPLS
jgi:glucose-6-phosphate 1-epimerase